MITIEFGVVLQFLVLATSLFFLVKSSDAVSNSAARIASFTGLGQMTIGFLLLSVVTSLPELAVAVSSISTGDVGISIGGLFGSNVANIGLILGLTAILAPTAFRITEKSFKSLALMLLLCSIVPIMALVPFGSNVYLGVLLLFLFGLFVGYSIKSKFNMESEEVERPQGLKRELLITFMGVAVVLASARFVVSSSVSISHFFNVEEAVIGATVVAVGTSLPELSVSLAAARKKHMNLALGNILGSCFTNLTLILGVVLAMSTFRVNITVFVELIIVLLLVNLALWRMLVDSKIGLMDGLILLLLYIFFLGSTLGVQAVVMSSEYLSMALNAMFETLSFALAYSVVAVVALILGITLTKG